MLGLCLILRYALACLFLLLAGLVAGLCCAAGKGDEHADRTNESPDFRD